MIEIGPMKESEIELVREMERRSGLRSFDHEWFERELGSEEATFLVARRPQDDLISGAITGWVAADEWQIDNLVVAEEFRERGVGAALVKAGARRAAPKGARCAVLEVRAGNVAARRLYERLGFIEAGLRRDYYREPTEDGVVMICAGEEWSRLVD